MKQFLLTLLLTTAPLLPATAQDTAEPLTLAQKLDTLVKYKLPQGSNVGIAAYDLTEERVLYSHQADKLSRPASTMKLLTTITALNRKEADEPFRTEVWAQGIIERDTLRGNLYVVGGMDPELDENALDSLAAQVTRAPFKVIEGYVCGDVSLRDSLYWGSGWLWDDNPYDFQPYLSPLMLCKGVVTVTAMPTAQGDTARLKCSPRSSYYTVGNRTQSRTPAAGRFKVDRNWPEGGNRISVSGNVSARQTGKVNVAGCERFFLHTFMERLQEQGIACREYKIEEHRKDSVSRLIAIHETPVQAVVNQIMKESDNLNAEAMLTRLGAQATGKRHISATDGLDAVRALIKQLGYNPDRYKLADGCGLSNYNYISPELLVAFLRHAYSRTDIFRKLYKALPAGGIDGTLKYRMKRGTPSYGNVHAKTGSYTAINTLAGYLQTHKGHWVAFAIMNQNVLSGREARAFQDAVTDMLVTE